MNIQQSCPGVYRHERQLKRDPAEGEGADKGWGQEAYTEPMGRRERDKVQEGTR